LPNSFLRENSWVICGGESGHGARQMQPEWARTLRDQTKAAGRPFFFKQWGFYDSDLILIGKKHWNGYNVLDGREWKQWPV
jgi:protein gp37